MHNKRRIVVALVTMAGVWGGAVALPPVVRGTVSDELGRPVARALVKLKSGKITRKFATTDAAGAYRLDVADSLRMNPVEFSALGFETQTVSADSLERAGDVMLEKAARELEEVIVRPDPFTAKGDTVLFNVDAIRTPADRTIEDVIKRLPGVSVDADGKISHNNEDINRFYVEGVDLLGGNYSLVSRNVGAEDVSTIALYAHHQPVKVLEGKEFSKHSAVEIKLKRRMLLAPHGFVEVGAGKENRNAAWQGRAYAMSVMNTTQTYANAVGGNFDNFRFSTLAGANSGVAFATTPFNGTFPESPLTSASADPLRYKRDRQWGTCLNIGGKTAKEATLSGFVGYSGGSSEWSGSTSSVYLRPGSDAVVMSNEGTARQHTQRIGANLKFELNKKGIYLRNQTAAMIGFRRNATELTTAPPPDIAQGERTNDVAVANRTELVVAVGRRTWQLTSNFSVRNLPLNLLTARNLHDGALTVGQSARALTFTNSERTSLSWGVGKRSMVGLALGFDADYTRVGSEAFGPGALELPVGGSPCNTTSGSRVTLNVGPYYSYVRGIADLRLDLPVQALLFNYRNIGAGRRGFSDATVDFSPRLAARLRFSKAFFTSLTLGHASAYGVYAILSSALCSAPTIHGRRMAPAHSDARAHGMPTCICILEILNSDSMPISWERVA